MASRRAGNAASPRAGDTLARRLRELEALHESLRALTATLDLGELLNTVLARMRALLQPQGLSLLLYDRCHDELVFAATELLREDAVLEPGVIDGSACGSARASRAGSRSTARRCGSTTRTATRDTTPAWRAAGLVPHGMICVPMVHRDRLLGVVQVINRLDGRPFTADEQRLVQSLADYAAVGIAHAQLYRDVELASLTDDLTGLGNTRALPPRPAPASSPSPCRCRILVLDLDHLKEVVDTHGHLVGSRTIATVGRLIAEQLRPGDVAARFGGDEFVAVLPSTDTDPARDVAERIRAAVAACPGSGRPQRRHHGR